MDKIFNAKRPFMLALLALTLCLTMGGVNSVYAKEPAANVAEEEELIQSLPVEKAFILNSRVLPDNQIELNFTIAKGYILYREHFHFKTLEGKIITPNPEVFPQGMVKHDEIQGDYQAYTNQLQLIIPTANETKPQGLRLQYQGCSEGGFCFAPFSPQGVAHITNISAAAFNKGTVASQRTTHAKADPQALAKNEVKDSGSVQKEESDSQTNFIDNQLRTGSFPVTLLVFLGLGIMLAFTPCVLPMVPIMANIIVGEKTPLSSRRASLLATLYVLSVAVCYAGAGVVAGLMGSQLQLALQKPVFIISLSFILVLFALGQFSLIRIPMPAVISNSLHNLQNKQKQGSVTGAIVMGMVSALMVSPCVTPALVGALTYIGQTGNAVLGGFALFAMALGMGLPLLIAACIGSHLLPKAGKWMNHIKNLTGVLLLVMAAFIFMRAFPSHQANEIVALSHFTAVQSEQDLNKALSEAKALKKMVILDVYADWCVSCKQLDREVFANKTVLANLKEATLLRLDLTNQTEESVNLQKQLNIVGPPTLIFFGHDGNEAKNYRLVGTIESGNFIKHVKQFSEAQTSK